MIKIRGVDMVNLIKSAIFYGKQMCKESIRKTWRKYAQTVHPTKD
jgi:hypothetical protein